MKAKLKLDDLNKFSGSEKRGGAFGFSAKLSAVANEGELKNCIQDAIIELGFSDFSIVNIDLISTPQLQLDTMPKPMIKSYYDKQFYTDDLTVARAKNNSSPFFASLLYDWIDSAPFENEQTQKMTAIYDLYKSYGYYESYHIPFKAVNGSFLLTIVSRGMLPNDFCKLINDFRQSLNLLADAIVLELTNRFSKLLPSLNEDLAINEKPLRVLRRLANSDHTIEQVASELCISTVTANQHLKTVRTKLGVRSNYAAIRRCVKLGLIKFHDYH
jgi:DNA-binding CsgD family transcriptional regulator